LEPNPREKREMGVYGGGGTVQLYLFLTSALDGAEWSASRPLPLWAWGNSHGYRFNRRLVGPHSQSRLSSEEIRLNLASPPGIEPPLLRRPARSLSTIPTDLSLLKPCLLPFSILSTRR
jgi:hypothetical protein